MEAISSNITFKFLTQSQAVFHSQFGTDVMCYLLMQIYPKIILGSLNFIFMKLWHTKLFRMHLFHKSRKECTIYKF